MANSKPVPARRSEAPSARNSARYKLTKRNSATKYRSTAMSKKFEFPCAAEYVKQGRGDNCRTRCLLAPSESEAAGGRRGHVHHESRPPYSNRLKRTDMPPKPLFIP